MIGLVSLIGASWGSPEKAAIEALVLDVAQRGRAICATSQRSAGARTRRAASMPTTDRPVPNQRGERRLSVASVAMIPTTRASIAAFSGLPQEAPINETSPTIVPPDRSQGF